MTTPKAPGPILRVLFDGADVVPEKIPLTLLTRALSAIQSIAAGRMFGEEEADEEQENEGQPGGGPFRLLQVTRGSAIYQISGSHPQSLLSRLRESGRILREPEDLGENDHILGPVERLSTIARSLECRIVVKEPGRHQPVLAVFAADTYEEFSRTLFFEGDTEVRGKVERVGGAKERKCGLRVSFQPNMLICKVVNEDVVRRLGEKLYQNVLVQGRATFLRTNDRIVRLVVNDVSQPQCKSLIKAIEAVREAGAKDWDKIDDPTAYLQQIGG